MPTTFRKSSLRAARWKPVSVQKYPKTEEAAEIVWEKDGSRIHASINADDIAYAVEVTGRPGAATKTGRGLSVMQTLEDLKRIYGPRFRKRGSLVTVQWRDGAELRATFASGRIVSLLLIAPVE